MEQVNGLKECNARAVRDCYRLLALCATLHIYLNVFTQSNARANICHAFVLSITKSNNIKMLIITVGVATLN